MMRCFSTNNNSSEQIAELRQKVRDLESQISSENHAKQKAQAELDTKSAECAEYKRRILTDEQSNKNAITELERLKRENTELLSSIERLNLSSSLKSQQNNEGVAPINALSTPSGAF